MFCPKCGSQVEDGAAFCSECGNPLELPQGAQQPQPQAQPYPQQAPQPQAQPYPQQAPQPQAQPYPQQAPQPQAQPYPQQAPQPQPQQASPSQPEQPQPQQPPQPQPKKRPPVAAIVAIVAFVAVAAVAAVVAFVVLPRVTQRGIWVATGSTTTVKDSDGTSTYTATHTLDDRGNPTAIHSDYAYADGSKYTADTTYSYDDKGFAKDVNSTSTYELKGESPVTEESAIAYQWTPGDGDKPSKVVRTKTDGTYTYTQSYEYGGDGHLSKVVSSEKGEDAQYEYVTEYNDRGLEVRSTTKGTYKDSETKKTVPYNRETVYTYEYDQSNRPIKRTETTTDTSTNKKVEESVITYEYDGNGNVSSDKTETTTYTDKGTQKSTSTSTYEYKHVDNPTPWVAELVRLSPLSFSAAHA